MKTTFLFASKAHVAAAIALVTTLLAAISQYGTFDETTAVPIIIALTGAFLVWLTPRATSGVLAYSKLGVAILTAAAQVVIPLVYNSGFGWAQVPVVALAIFSAYKVWETADEKSATNLAVNTEYVPAPVVDEPSVTVSDSTPVADTTVAAVSDTTEHVPEHEKVETPAV